VVNLLRSALVLVLLLAMSSTTGSAFTVVGQPWFGNSWGQRFDHTAAAEFDCLRIDWVYGSDFELPTVFENFDNDNWSASYENNILASARGTSVTTLEFDIIFGGEIGPTEFTFATYLRNAPQEYYTAEYTSGPLANYEWIITHNPGDPPPVPPLAGVPEPGSLLLLGAGLAAAGFVRGRRRKAIQKAASEEVSAS
jgi:hypothetical protein